MKQGPLFSNISTGEAYYDSVDLASYKGVCAKTFFLLAISIIVAGITIYYLPTIILEGNFTGFYIALGISSLVGFISVMVGRISERFARGAGVIYSLCEGLFLGTLTCIIDNVVPGASMIAIFATVIIFTVMLTLFATGIIRVTNKFRGILLAMGLSAIGLILFTSIIGMFVDLSGLLGLIIPLELFFILYGVLTLASNFQEAQYVVESGCSKQAEWSVALGLIVSIIYIYIRVLRFVLIILSRSRD